MFCVEDALLDPLAQKTTPLWPQQRDLVTHLVGRVVERVFVFRGTRVVSRVLRDRHRMSRCCCVWDLCNAACWYGSDGVCRINGARLENVAMERDDWILSLNGRK